MSSFLDFSPEKNRFSFETEDHHQNRRRVSVKMIENRNSPYRNNKLINILPFPN